MAARSKLLALAFGTAVACGIGAGALAIAGRGPFEPAPPPPAPQLTPEEVQARLAEERARGFAALCARVDAPPATRPFDRALLAPRTAVSADEELASMRAELELAGTLCKAGSQWQRSRHDSSFATRLALFPWRFGKDPRTQPGWAPLVADAQRLLAELDQRPPVMQLNPKDSYAALYRAQLLELAGRTADADAALASVEVWTGCGNCDQERWGYVIRRRSEAAERRGDLALALKLVDDFGSYLLGGNLLTEDDGASLARCGLLMLQTGRESDGRCVLQAVVELRPLTPAAEVARAALEQTGSVREPTLERLQRVWIGDGTDYDPYRRWAVGALAGLPEAAGLPRLLELHAADDHAALAGLIALHDERTRPLLECALLEEDLWGAEKVLAGLDALPGGAARYARPLLERIAAMDAAGTGVNAEALDEALRGALGGGPPMDPSRLNDHRLFAHAWLEWMAAGGR